MIENYDEKWIMENKWWSSFPYRRVRSKNESFSYMFYRMFLNESFNSSKKSSSNLSFVYFSDLFSALLDSLASN